MLEPVPGTLTGGAHRPAQVWRLQAQWQGRLSLSERSLGLGAGVGGGER